MCHSEPWQIELRHFYLQSNALPAELFDTSRQGKDPLALLQSFSQASGVFQISVECEAHRLLGDTQLSCIIKVFSTYLVSE